MKKIVFCLIALFVFASVPAFGAGGHDDHSGHGHDHDAELNQSQILEKASEHVARLVEKGKLDASWKTISPQEAKKNNANEWIVTFVNPEIKESGQNTLYMFLSASGKYIAANFTGK